MGWSGRAGLGLVAASLLLSHEVDAQGTPLGPEFRVNTYATGYQWIPSVASDASGNFVVVWQGGYDDGGMSGIFGQRYAASGTPLGPEFRVDSYPTGYQSRPDVASDPAGNFVVVWVSYVQDGSLSGLFAQRFAASGAPLGSEFRVNTYTTGDQFGPSVVSDASGNFVVVWTSYGQDGSYGGAFGQRYASSGAPLGPEFRVNTYTSSAQRDPLVASDSTGGFVVVWASYAQDGSSFGAFGQRYASSGAPVGPEFRVNSYTSGSQGPSGVAVDGGGSFVVVWTSYHPDEAGSGVFGQRFANSGTPLGAEFRVNTYTTADQGFPAIAMDAAGNFVIVWQSFQQDGDLNGIFGQRYDGSGVPLGPEFRANSTTFGGQFRPAVAADSSGDFVVVWNSDDDPGPFISFGVFGQRYGPILPVELLRLDVE